MILFMGKDDMCFYRNTDYVFLDIKTPTYSHISLLTDISHI